MRSCWRMLLVTTVESTCVPLRTWIPLTRPRAMSQCLSTVRTTARFATMTTNRSEQLCIDCVLVPFSVDLDPAVVRPKDTVVVDKGGDLKATCNALSSLQTVTEWSKVQCNYIPSNKNHILWHHKAERWWLSYIRLLVDCCNLKSSRLIFWTVVTSASHVYVHVSVWVTCAFFVTRASEWTQSFRPSYFDPEERYLWHGRDVQLCRDCSWHRGNEDQRWTACTCPGWVCLQAVSCQQLAYATVYVAFCFSSILRLCYFHFDGVDIFCQKKRICQYFNMFYGTIG